MKIKLLHVINLESENFTVEINANFEDDNYGLTVGDSYSNKVYLHLADDTARELIELLALSLDELYTYMNKAKNKDAIDITTTIKTVGLMPTKKLYNSKKRWVNTRTGERYRYKSPEKYGLVNVATEKSKAKTTFPVLAENVRELTEEEKVKQ